MRSVRACFFALGLLTLAACGGGSSGSGPLPPAASDAGVREPSGSTVVFEHSTLWVGYELGINAYPTEANGPVTALKHLGDIPWHFINGHAFPEFPGIVDLAVAPDGTKWVLENYDAFMGGVGWRLFAIGPGDTTPENVEGDDTSYPISVALGDDGVFVASSSRDGRSWTIAEYPYGASNAQPIRSIQTTSQVVGMAIGNEGHLYVARPSSVDVYGTTAGGCCPLRSIAVPVGYVGAHGFAVGPDTSIYVTELAGKGPNPALYVNVYSSKSGALQRRIGPLPTSGNAFGFPVITVDGRNRLYVATDGKIYRFGPRANGAVTQPGWVDPAHSRPHSMAVGPKQL